MGISSIICKGCGGTISFEDIPAYTLCECSDCGAEFIIPEFLGSLQLENFLGKMACFEVYHGFDTATGMESTIYILDSNTDGITEEILKAAQKHVFELSDLKHGNISPILNYGTVNGKFFVVEPLFDGFPLSDYCAETQGLLDIRKVTDILQAATLGLAVIHSKGFVHHRICPEIIHIDARGTVRIKALFASSFSHIWATEFGGKMDISPYFVSPEKVETSVEDKRGDVFSMAAVWYYMMTGTYPFKGESMKETIYSRVQPKKEEISNIYSASARMQKVKVDYIPPVSPSKIRNGFPQIIENIIIRSLSYQMTKRPTVLELLDILAAFQAQDEQEKTLIQAQKTMVTTKTRAIPKMAPLVGSNAPKKKKFFL